MTTRVLRPIAVALATLAASFWFVPSAAAPAPSPVFLDAAPAFAASALSDEELGDMRGSYLARGTLATFADSQARDDFRQTAAVGTLTFDNWFNDNSALIFNNLLARQP